MYQIGILCKHFKGTNLIEKNIYQIIDINVDPRSIDFSKVTYSGDNNVMNATDLILYANIYQDNKLFVREESDIASKLDEEKQKIYGQVHRVEPLTEEEIRLISTQEFISEKQAYMQAKQNR